MTLPCAQNKSINLFIPLPGVFHVACLNEFLDRANLKKH